MFQCMDCLVSTSVRRFLAIESIIFSGSGSPPNSSMLYDPNILQGGREGGREELWQLQATERGIPGMHGMRDHTWNVELGLLF